MVQPKCATVSILWSHMSTQTCCARFLKIQTLISWQWYMKHNGNSRIYLGKFPSNSQSESPWVCVILYAGSPLTWYVSYWKIVQPKSRMVSITHVNTDMLCNLYRQTLKTWQWYVKHKWKQSHIWAILQVLANRNLPECVYHTLRHT